MADARIPIWLDCDPGHDDAMAIILAAYHPGSELLGITTVHGNASLQKCTENALKICTLAGLPPHITVTAGAAKPLLRSAKACAEIHGETGLDGPDLPVSDRTATGAKAAIVMAEALQRAARSGRRPTLVCCGALTNAALLLSLYPELASAMRLVIMGGTFGTGNTGPCSEFNLQLDPEAAAIVFESGVDLSMVPLEVTHTALVTPAVLASVGDSTPFRRIIAELLLFFSETYKRVFFFEHPPLHDPCAVLLALTPQAFETKRLRVDIETRSELCAGQSVADVWGQGGKKPNVIVAHLMDVDLFFQAFLAAVAAADAASPVGSKSAAALAAAAAPDSAP